MRGEGFPNGRLALVCVVFLLAGRFLGDLPRVLSDANTPIWALGVQAVGFALACLWSVLSFRRAVVSWAPKELYVDDRA